jgi:hypothetical protein
MPDRRAEPSARASPARGREPPSLACGREPWSLACGREPYPVARAGDHDGSRSSRGRDR